MPSFLYKNVALKHWMVAFFIRKGESALSKKILLIFHPVFTSKPCFFFLEIDFPKIALVFLISTFRSWPQTAHSYFKFQKRTTPLSCPLVDDLAFTYT